MHKIFQAEAIPPLVALISSSNPSVCEQSLWALGNIAGEGAWARDRVLAAGALQPLMVALRAPGASLQRTAVWALSNLCRNKAPQVEFSKVSPALPVLTSLLSSQDKDVLGWYLLYFFRWWLHVAVQFCGRRLMG